jgi:hypothetical protein
MTEWLIVPDGPLAGEPLILTPEQAQFVLDFYAIDHATGKRVIRRGVLSRPKGWGKSPLLAGLCIAEALAPVVPNGWDAAGEPVGIEWRELGFKPKAQILGVSEDQTANTWDPLLDMIREGPLVNEPGVEAMESFVNVPRGGSRPPRARRRRARASARSSRSSTRPSRGSHVERRQEARRRGAPEPDQDRRLERRDPQLLPPRLRLCGRGLHKAWDAAAGGQAQEQVRHPVRPPRGAGRHRHHRPRLHARRAAAGVRLLGQRRLLPRRAWRPRPARARLGRAAAHPGRLLGPVHGPVRRPDVLPEPDHLGV